MTTSPNTEANGGDDRGDRNQLLLELLHEAARLEHCLLDSYLFTACSLKTLPVEFASLPDGRENRRRAIQFERVRAWKQAILGVAHEEMLHLHYVECLIRALGEAPYLGLPPRDAETGNWTFSEWTARVGARPTDGRGTEVPVEPLTPSNIRRFVVYESTDALQDEDPFGPVALELFGRLHDLELDLLLESVLYDVEDETERETLKEKLRQLYVELSPVEAAPPEQVAELVAEPIQIGEIRFQSIADLYNKAILPLYQEAFHYRRVPNTDLGLVGELQDQNYAAEGFLPILPVSRDKNFDQAAATRVATPLGHYRRVEEVVAEIVEEGEGQQAFDRGARALLAKVTELGGARAYVTAVKADNPSSPDPTPGWLQECQRIRLSHLYQFAMTMIDLDHEIGLARTAGTEFAPSRSPIATENQPQVDELASTLAAQFNAVYLCLLMWLSRIYEIKNWESDRRRRMGIEMLAAWPMMSIAIRPFLELASFLPVEPRDLFRIEAIALPDAPLHARQLLELHEAGDRSQAINDRMDYYALHALSDVAVWASEQREALAESVDLEPHAREAMMARLQLLATLNEFKRQFPFREHGGYSDRSPDETFLMEHTDGQRYEEDGAQSALFADTFVLRVRFAGRELVQLATDPDPPVDEAGCTGTHMLHAADGDEHWFDRALVWQPQLERPRNVILREPQAGLPPLGVRVAELALLVTGDEPAASGYIPLGVMSSAGAVQTQGVQQVAQVTGLNLVEDLEAGGLRVALLPRAGQMPFLNGYNHVVSQDGEPIDPFILALIDDAGGVVCQREIFNEGKTLMQMAPLQRLLSTRGPCGFDGDLTDIPGWALAMLSPEEREQLANPSFPISYLAARAATLEDALQGALAAPEWTRESVDGAISFAERLRLIANPRGTTIGWLAILLNYGHTVSGEMGEPATEPIGIDPTRAGLKLSVASPSRSTPNGRWFASYTQGFMDTDALSAMIYGEVYVPLVVSAVGEPVSYIRRWRFARGMQAVVAGFGARFATPFWAPAHVHDNTRTFTLGDGTTITEMLTDFTDTSYTYTLEGVAGISDYVGSFTVDAGADAVALAWATTFTPADPAATVRMSSIIAAAAVRMTVSLASHFGPASSS